MLPSVEAFLRGKQLEASAISQNPLDGWNLHLGPTVVPPYSIAKLLELPGPGPGPHGSDQDCRRAQSEARVVTESHGTSWGWLEHVVLAPNPLLDHHFPHDIYNFMGYPLIFTHAHVMFFLHCL